MNIKECIFKDNDDHKINREFNCEFFQSQSNLEELI